MMVMEAETGWRGVIVAPPSPLAGIGGALRYAYAIDGDMRSLDAFSDLLDRLDETCRQAPETRH